MRPFQPQILWSVLGDDLRNKLCGYNLAADLAYRQGLSQRHIQMIALAGAIGTVSSGS